MQAMTKRLTRLAGGVILAFGAAFAAQASDPVERTSSTALWFESWGRLSNATLTVVTPQGTHADVFAKSGSPTFHLRDINPVTDGVYRYELTAAGDKMVANTNQLDNGRGAAAKSQVPEPFRMNGIFFVTRGVISETEKQIEE